MKIDVVGFSVKGVGRKVNRDAFLIDQTMGFAAVADSVGITSVGPTPSRFAIEHVHNCLPLIAQRLGKGWRYALKRAILNANEELLKMRETQPSQGGATTLTCCLITDQRAIFAHLGDSRAYLVRNGRISQVTRDETLAALLLEKDLITQSAVRKHPGRNQVLNALGTQREIRVTTLAKGLKKDDQVILCTDGVASVLPEERLFEILTDKRKRFDSVAKRLVNGAIDAGSRDDATAVALRILPLPRGSEVCPEGVC